MAKRKLTKAVTLLNDIQDKFNEVKGLLADYEVSLPEIMISVPFGIKELAEDFKASVKCSPPNELLGHFDAYFIVRGIKFVTYFIPERERAFYEEQE